MHQFVQGTPFLHSDETRFKQGNADGNNPEHQQGWLWTIVTESVVLFEVALSRGGAIARRLIGDDYAGIVISDRYLRLWHQVRDGTLSRTEFQFNVALLRRGFKAPLEQAVGLLVEAKEKSPLAKTLGTCKELLKWECALWTFVFHDGIEPTNNAAEQVLRPAVIWRRLSFGTQSEAGSQGQEAVVLKDGELLTVPELLPGWAVVVGLTPTSTCPQIAFPNSLDCLWPPE